MEITNIKVTASYEYDNSHSKFDALLTQYNIAKKIADETKAIKQPLINAMGEKKLELIMEQLETIKKYASTLSMLQNDACVAVRAIGKGGAHCVKITHSNKWGDKFTIYLDGYENPIPSWFEEHGIVTRWNELNLYESLKQDCERQLERLIQRANSSTDKINNLYNTMIND